MKHAEFNHVVEPQRCDAQRRLPMTTIIAWLIEAASDHAESRGFGYTKLREANTAWVLARLVVEINRYPKAYDEVLLETWVDDFNRLFSTRNFALTAPLKSTSGELRQTPFGFAKTQWSMIDLDSRKACDLSALSAIADFKDERPCPIAPPGKIQPVSGNPIDTYRIRYADIDVNRHMNTVKYIEHVLNLFPLDYYDRHFLKRMEVQFIAEARFGDTLSFYRKEEDGASCIVEVRNQHGNAINRFKLQFGNECEF